MDISQSFYRHASNITFKHNFDHIWFTNRSLLCSTSIAAQPPSYQYWWIIQITNTHLIFRNIILNMNDFNCKYISTFHKELLVIGRLTQQHSNIHIFSSDRDNHERSYKHLQSLFKIMIYAEPIYLCKKYMSPIGSSTKCPLFVIGST